MNIRSYVEMKTGDDKMIKSVYMDNNATTATKKEVVEAMLPYYTDIWGNASSKFYQIGMDAINALDKMRAEVAANIGAAKPNEIYFTGSGCEADNWAIKGIAFAHKDKGNHIITSKIEHHAVLNTCAFLEKHGFKVTYIDVDSDGIVNPQDVEKAITEDTILISIMTANNEIGTIEPIKEIGEIARKHKILFHTDAVQAIGHMPINVQDLGVDMMSVSAHKFHGPKGVGFLYIRNGVKIDNLIHGGGQERGKRAATENLAGIAGLSKALDIAVKNLDNNIKTMTEKRDRLIKGIRDNIPYCVLNGPENENRLCNNVNFSFRYVEGESILMLLNMYGIAASSGSACASGSLDPSHVLLAIGLPAEVAHGSVRLSLSEDTTDEEIDYVIEVLPKIIQRLRDMSPLYEKVLKGEVE
jgi:cysteine desulfurase